MSWWNIIKNINVFVPGVYDRLHIGHLEIFNEAKSIGDNVIIGVINDEGVALKGKTGVQNQQERFETVERENKGKVILTDGTLEDYKRIYEEYNISIHLVGHDHIDSIDSPNLKTQGIEDLVEVVYLPRERDISSTKLREG
jgi:cytidyltransferase-like protein